MTTVTISGGDKLQEFLKKIKTQSKETLNVGFLTPDIAKIAIKNEFGGVFPIDDEYRARAKAKGINLGIFIEIPPRPFMQQTINNNSDKWGKVIAKLLSQDLSLNKTLNGLGQVITNNITETIEEGDFTANSARTIKIKGTATPLVDTGNMAKSVNWEVV